MLSKIEESIFKELEEKKSDEETTVQIRLFDNRTGMTFYKQLTQKELARVIGTWDKMHWK